MGISWTTFIAQIVNFLILVWVLNKFLYRPVVVMIEKRQNQIKDRLQSAEKTLADAEALKAEYAQKMDAFEDEKAAAFVKADQEILQYACQQKQVLKESLSQAQERLKTDIMTQHEQAKEALRQNIAMCTVQLVSRILQDLSLPEMKTLVIGHIAEQIKGLKAKDRKKLMTLIKAKTPVVLTTPTPLQAQDLTPLKHALKEICQGKKIDILCREDDSLLMGAVLSIGPVEINWTLDDYLNDWDVHVKQALTVMPEVAHV